MAVTHGNDPHRLDAIGDALRAEGDRVEEVLGSGTSGIAVLVGAWSGPDLEGFVGDWQGAQQQLASAAQLLRAVGQRAKEQAADQRSASGEGGTGSPFDLGTGRGLGAAALGGNPGRPPSDSLDLPDDYEDGPKIPFRDKGQIPQGLGYNEADDELVYTFYDEDDDTDGEIVFVDRETGEVTSRVPLEGLDHYGGVTVNGEYTYVSGGGNTQVYRTEDLRNPETTTIPNPGAAWGGDPTMDVVHTAEPIDTVDTKAHSTVTVHDDKLYVTQFTKGDDDPGTMYAYEIGADGSPTGEPKTYQVPPQTQGVSFDEAGNAYYSSSYGRNNESTLTRVSAEDFARDGGWTQDNGRSQEIPNMAEGSVVVDGRLYQLYESGADKYDDNPGPDFIVDRVVGDTDPRDRLTVHDLRK